LPAGRLSRPRFHTGPHRRPPRPPRSSLPVAPERDAAAPAGSGDPLLAEIAAVYQTAFGRFLRVSAAILGDVEQGRDAVQDAFARAIVRRREYRGDGPLEAWLWRIVVNHACNSRRSGRQLASQAEWRPSEKAAPARDSGDPAVRELIASLPERQRVALFLRYYADFEYDQIAETLGIRPGTVAATLSAAHRSLRARLETKAVRKEGMP
jgi:RNA polymerase sigma-70 factor (ECF subfamily)